jgi:hypothetical protein
VAWQYSQREHLVCSLQIKLQAQKYNFSSGCTYLTLLRMGLMTSNGSWHVNISSVLIF